MRPEARGFLLRREVGVDIVNVKVAYYGTVGTTGLRKPEGFVRVAITEAHIESGDGALEAGARHASDALLADDDVEVHLDIGESEGVEIFPWLLLRGECSIHAATCRTLRRQRGLSCARIELSRGALNFHHLDFHLVVVPRAAVQPADVSRGDSRSPYPREVATVVDDVII